MNVQDLLQNLLNEKVKGLNWGEERIESFNIDKPSSQWKYIRSFNLNKNKDVGVDKKKYRLERSCR